MSRVGHGGLGALRGTPGGGRWVESFALLVRLPPLEGVCPDSLIFLLQQLFGMLTCKSFRLSAT